MTQKLFGTNKLSVWTGLKSGITHLIGTSMTHISAGTKEVNLMFLIIAWIGTWKHGQIKQP